MNKIPNQQMAKIWAYGNYFKKELNLVLEKPSADTCDKCDTFTLRHKESHGSEKSTIQQEYKELVKIADATYKF